MAWHVPGWLLRRYLSRVPKGGYYTEYVSTYERVETQAVCTEDKCDGAPSPPPSPLPPSLKRPRLVPVRPKTWCCILPRPIGLWSLPYTRRPHVSSFLFLPSWEQKQQRTALTIAARLQPRPKLRSLSRPAPSDYIRSTLGSSISSAIAWRCRPPGI